MHNALIGFERMDGTVTMNYLGSLGGILHFGNISQRYSSIEDVQKLVEASEHEGSGVSSFNKDYEPSYYDDGDDLVIHYQNAKEAIDDFLYGGEVDYFFIFRENDSLWYVYNRKESSLDNLFNVYVKL